MQKIISLFKRDYEGTRLVYDEVVPSAEWVIEGEGVGTIKFDGTACMIRRGKLFKRHDRKMKKPAYKRKKAGDLGPWTVDDFKPAPEGWEAAESEPNIHTGHWPGWVPVSDAPEDKWHREAWNNLESIPRDGTYELVGPKVQSNPYQLESHELWLHRSRTIDAPRSFEGLKEWFQTNKIEGVVWWHPDGRMVKIKRRDFGLEWPLSEGE